MSKQKSDKRHGKARCDQYLVAANLLQEQLSAAVVERWRTPFLAESLLEYHWLRQRDIGHSELLTRSSAIPRIDVSPEVLSYVFSTDRPDHAFQQEPLRWGFGLTEPMVTKTLARLLASGSEEMRARRIYAFLRALDLPEGCASHAALKHCRIVAEQDRVDLKLVWKDAGDRDVVVIIEAKFGHKITPGQLRGYWEAIRRTHKCRPIASILLTLDDSVCKDLKNMQRRNWKQVDWRNFWLRFERLRPIEHNASLQMFMHTLWHRSGCLTQEDRYGCI